MGVMLHGLLGITTQLFSSLSLRTFGEQLTSIRQKESNTERQRYQAPCHIAGSTVLASCSDEYVHPETN